MCTIHIIMESDYNRGENTLGNKHTITDTKDSSVMSSFKLMLPQIKKVFYNDSNSCSLWK